MAQMAHHTSPYIRPHPVLCTLLASCIDCDLPSQCFGHGALEFPHVLPPLFYKKGRGPSPARNDCITSSAGRCPSGPGAAPPCCAPSCFFYGIPPLPLPQDPRTVLGGPPAFPHTSSFPMPPPDTSNLLKSRCSNTAFRSGCSSKRYLARHSSKMPFTFSEMPSK